MFAFLPLEDEKDKWARCEKCRASYKLSDGRFSERRSCGSINGTVNLSQDVYCVINSRIAPTRIAIIQAPNRVVQLCKLYKYC